MNCKINFDKGLKSMRNFWHFELTIFASIPFITYLVVVFNSHADGVYKNG